MTNRLVVVADTHVPRRARELPRPFLDAVVGADAIVHLGDFTSSEILETLRTFAPVHAVHGNNDDAELKSILPAMARLTIGGHCLILIHGHFGGATAIQAARQVVGGDAVLFGHSHQPYSRTEEGRLLFNPGSPTDRRWVKHRSFGVIEIDDTLHPTIVPLP